MNIVITKNTAIFCRDEAKTMEYIGPQEFRGFGHELEKAYTISQISDSTGHHRVISYRFSDLNIIIRHETDAYVDTDTTASSRGARNDALDGPSSVFGTLSLLSANSPPRIDPSGSKFVIKEEGQLITLESTLEIKTEYSISRLRLKSSHHSSGYLKLPSLCEGTTRMPVVEDVAAAVKSWEERKRNDLEKLAALIREIINLVKECGGKAVLRYNVEGDKLVICKVEREDMLPKDLYLKWGGMDSLEMKADIQDDSMQGSKVAQTRRESMATLGILCSTPKDYPPGSNRVYP
ncbi:hypothetical protein LTR47_011679 [Exophiala xenobiotica]|nr:hypothetical protein LTR92_011441 [Exophiala xenobiotica]KAK5218823.1 hypothetical protein LTR47_011679 [Exophiala xenobiotica]KAK5243141.1 hypothetical protein LTS06_011029 [Exophiala xenobiotica]KAK5281417.1 hypothetical protein LTR40_004877 [Exophiala xenobiotica]KAK5344522.1 hypothetical protein LTR61_011706 [Exophiala xenobiotica]